MQQTSKFVQLGQVYHAALYKEEDLPSASDILGWLAFIEIQCPECGVPEWPR